MHACLYTDLCDIISIINNHFKRYWKRQGNNSNTTERQSNTTQLSLFKEKLAALGGTWTHNYLLSRQHSYQLSYQGSSAGWDESCTNQHSISSWWTGELKLSIKEKAVIIKPARHQTPNQLMCVNNHFKRCWERQGNKNTTERQRNTKQLAYLHVLSYTSHSELTYII